MKTIPTPPAAESALIAHTPLPWYISDDFGSKFRQIVSRQLPGFRSDYRRIADCHYSAQLANCCTLLEAEANAALIVTAVNAHAAAQQRIAELEKALQPFADCEPLVTSMGNVPDDHLFLWKPSQTSKELPGISVAHIKQARLALRHPGRT